MTRERDIFFSIALRVLLDNGIEPRKAVTIASVQESKFYHLAATGSPSAAEPEIRGTLRDAISAGLGADWTREREDRLFWTVTEFVSRVHRELMMSGDEHDREAMIEAASAMDAAMMQLTTRDSINILRDAALVDRLHRGLNALVAIVGKPWRQA